MGIIKRYICGWIFKVFQNQKRTKSNYNNSAIEKIVKTKSDPPEIKTNNDFQNTAIEWPTLSELKTEPADIKSANNIEKPVTPIGFNKIVESKFDLITEKVEKISIKAEESNSKKRNTSFGAFRRTR